MNNRIVYGVIFGLLGLSGIILGMELDEHNKKEFFSLCIKSNGSGVIKNCTSDPLLHLAKTKVKKIEDVKFTKLGPLLERGEKFHLETQGNAEEKERYLIDQVTVKSWPMQWNEIKDGKYESIIKCFTSGPVVYDLQDNKATNVPILNCSTVNEVQKNLIIDMTETFSSIALVVFAVYFCRNHFKICPFFSKS